MTPYTMLTVTGSKKHQRQPSLPLVVGVEITTISETLNFSRYKKINFSLAETFKRDRTLCLCYNTDIIGELFIYQQIRQSFPPPRNDINT